MTIPLPPGSKPPAPPAHYVSALSPSSPYVGAPIAPTTTFLDIPNAPGWTHNNPVNPLAAPTPLSTPVTLTNPDIVQQIISSTLTPVHATDPKVLLFITNYNLTKDVKQAARQSGLHANDGKHLINRKDIYDCIQKIAQAGSRKFGYDAEEVVAKVKEVIEFDPIDLIDPSNGTFYEDISQIPPEARRVIKKLTVQNVYDKDPNGVIIGLHSKILKFEFWDKLKAAEMLGGEKDIFKKQVKVEHDVGKNMRETLLGRLEDADSRKALKAKDVTSG